MINWPAFTVFLVLFLLVTVLGFVASRWRQGDLDLLHEWGLAGRRFGTVVTWFLLGGDLYTAYTFIAVPALIFGAGAIGFFAVPYTIIVYPFVFVVMPRLWSVAKRHGYITAADFVEGRYGSKGLALAVAATGILATMPYIALQLVGMQAVLTAMGVPSLGFDLPLVVAFAVLAAYTYLSGLRAPALIAVVKDILIYVTILAAVIIIPARLGGYGAVFRAAQAALAHAPHPASVILGAKAFSAYATLALGSALALFLYPHSLTGVLAARSRNVVRRNAALLPAYSFLLGLIALLGYMALAAHVQVKAPSAAVPALFLKMFPPEFAGFGFAAIAIGALVPAAIMSIAAANLFTRNVYRAFIRPDCSDRQESNMAKLVSLVVKVGALFFVVAIPPQYAINLQLLGGIWILQTFPTIVLGLYTGWFHRWALLLGWAAGMVAGTAMAVAEKFTSVFPLHLGSAVVPAYAALWALLLNGAVVLVLTLLFRALHLAPGSDETHPADFHYTDGDLPAEEIPTAIM